MSRHLWAPHEPQFAEDPYSMYRRLREEDPVHLAQTDEWIVSRYEDVKFVLKSPDFRSGNRLEWLTRGIKYLGESEQDFQSIYDAINTFLLFLNPPDHQIIRTYVQKAWDNRAVENIITSRVSQQLDAIKEKSFDIMEQFAQPVPVFIIADIMGIPAEDYRKLRELGVQMHRSLDLYHSYKDLVTLNEASKQFVAYFREAIKQKTIHPDDGLISKLVHSPSRGVLEEKHLISLLIFLFTASEETTANGIGTGLLHLIRHPEIYAALRQHPEKISSTVDELLRYDAPVQLLGRIAKKNLDVGGKAIPANANLTLLLGSANRDPNQFKNADNLIADRTPNPHLSFSTGTHFCLGDWLGKLQMQIALREFVLRFPTIRLTTNTLFWKKNLAIRGLKSLPVNVN